jgi:hypothetical protein
MPQTTLLSHFGSRDTLGDVPKVEESKPPKVSMKEMKGRNAAMLE